MNALVPAFIQSDSLCSICFYEMCFLCTYGRSFDMSNPKFSDPLDPWLSSGGQALPRAVIPTTLSPDARQKPMSMTMRSPTHPGQGLMAASFAQRSDVFHSFLMDSSESDMLPFALDGDGLNGQDAPTEGECSTNLCAGTSTSGEICICSLWSPYYFTSSFQHIGFLPVLTQLRISCYLLLS